MSRPDPYHWGVARDYYSVDGQHRFPPQETLDSILDSMGADTESPPDTGPLVVRAGEEYRIDGDARLDLEDGSCLDVQHLLPPDLPTGYHRSTTADGDRRLIVAPPRCTPVGNPRSWGWAVQLYAARSETSWGMGDLGALRRFGATARNHGADMVLLNPLHASVVGTPQESSPYFPSSRGFRNPLYIDVEGVAAAAGETTDVQDHVRAGREMNRDRRIDRDAVWQLKNEALHILWSRGVRRDALHPWIATQAGQLRDYATFCVLTETHGRDWRAWPSQFRRHDGGALDVFRRENNERVEFHMWLQMLLAEQFDEAAGEIDVMNDLAIGVDPSGADAWMWQDSMCLDMRVGAPPDEFNTRGQDWSLPPFDPWKLRANDYAPFISMLRANMSIGAAIRIDHVMGLFRLFWIPEGRGPHEGTYVSYRGDEMLAILALESQRSGCYVVGEDLGTVEPHVREQLAANSVLSYKLMWFEDAPAAEFPEQSMAAITTHDLPTVAGVASGRDLEMQHEMQLDPNVESMNHLAGKLHSWAGGEVDPAETNRRVHGELARASSQVVTATLEDALGCLERPNYPGTTTQYPNWSVALPVSVEELPANEGFNNVSETLSAGRKT